MQLQLPDVLYVRKTEREIAACSRPGMTLSRWLEIAGEARDAGMLYLLLTGGEPFLWPDFWELYEQLARMGFLISINSNGSLLDRAAVARLAKNPPTCINITLYGASDATYSALCRVPGTFSRVDDAIEALKAAGMLVKLNGSLTPYNAGDLEAMNRYAEERGLILEVNTYMFPPIRRDPSMVGRNERFTPEEAAQYHMKRYRIQYGVERYKSFLENVVKRILPPAEVGRSLRWHSLRRCRLLAIHTSN
jgi:MoaA/NifB/PqqE/SkfB family radical SAM enzyme